MADRDKLERFIQLRELRTRENVPPLIDRSQEGKEGERRGVAFWREGDRLSTVHADSIAR